MILNTIVLEVSEMVTTIICSYLHFNKNLKFSHLKNFRMGILTKA